MCVYVSSYGWEDPDLYYYLVRFHFLFKKTLYPLMLNKSFLASCLSCSAFTVTSLSAERWSLLPLLPPLCYTPLYRLNRVEPITRTLNLCPYMHLFLLNSYCLAWMSSLMVGKKWLVNFASSLVAKLAKEPNVKNNTICRLLFCSSSSFSHNLWPGWLNFVYLCFF